MIANPLPSLIVIAFLVTFIMTLVTKKFTNQNRMKELKELQKACKIKLKDHKGDMAKQGEINKEMMACTMELMKHSFKPMLYTLIPLLIFFWWIRGIYTPILDHWIWWYLGAGITSSIILRKVLKVV